MYTVYFIKVECEVDAGIRIYKHVPRKRKRREERESKKGKEKDRDWYEFRTSFLRIAFNGDGAEAEEGEEEEREVLRYTSMNPAGILRHNTP